GTPLPCSESLESPLQSLALFRSTATDYLSIVHQRHLRLRTSNLPLHLHHHHHHPSSFQNSQLNTASHYATYLQLLTCSRRGQAICFRLEYKVRSTEYPIATFLFFSSTFLRVIDRTSFWKLNANLNASSSTLRTTYGAAPATEPALARRTQPHRVL